MSVDSTSSGLSPLKVRRRRRSCSVGSAYSTPGSNDEDSVASETVARVLENIFVSCGPVSSPFASVIAPSTSDSSRHSSLLPLLAHHLVGHVIERLSSLGYNRSEHPCFPSDDGTGTMFDLSSSTPDPLTGYGPRQRTQLIDVWYSMHPLSFLVSKTLLLRELRDGTQDDILLAAMMAYAQYIIGDETSVSRGHALFAWAASQLRTRSRNTRTDACTTPGASTRVYSGISTVQSLILLAWNALWSSQLRRATCYLRLARDTIAEIKEVMERSPPPTSSRINGVDVADVEREIVSYMDWTSFSLSLWISLEIGEAAPIALPNTEASSAMIQLDLVSENLSTLQKQKSVIKEMWPLTCIVSMVSRVADLSIADGGLTNHCIQSTQGLVEDVQHLHDQPDITSRNLVLVFHHVLNIHLLFPKGQQSMCIPSAETIEKLLSSSDEILQLLAVSFQHISVPFSVPSSLHFAFPDAFSLALDTCSRAIGSIYTSLNLDMSDACLWQGYTDRMRVVAKQLYEASRQDCLNQGSRIRQTRKQLKACARALGSISVPATGGLPTPDLGFMSLSERQMSQTSDYPTSMAPQAATHTPSPFSYFREELPALSSSMPSSTGSSLGAPMTSFAEMDKPVWVFDPTHEIPNHCVSEQSVDTTSASSIWCPQISIAMDFDVTVSLPMQFEDWNWPTLEASDSGHSDAGYDRFKPNHTNMGL